MERRTDSLLAVAQRVGDGRHGHGSVVLAEFDYDGNLACANRRTGAPIRTRLYTYAVLRYPFPERIGRWLRFFGLAHHVHRSGSTNGFQQGQRMSVEQSVSNHEHLTRRRFVAATSTATMAGGLVAGYGTFGVMAGRFLYPTENENVGWQFVALADELAAGDSREYVSPSGEKVVIARQGAGASADDFIALSSVCPHLGCQVHWEPQNDRFYCPCHNGAFDPQGKATEGPPAKAKQELVRFKVNIVDGMLFILAPLKRW